MSRERHFTTKLVSVLPLLGLLSACLTVDPETQRPLGPVERDYGLLDDVWGSDFRKFHEVLHYPQGTGPRFAGYVVGIEKAPQGLVGGPKTDPTVLTKTRCEEGAGVRSRLSWQAKAQVLTHVVESELVTSKVLPRFRSRTLYSLYPPEGQWPDTGHEPARGLFQWKEGGLGPGDETAFRAGWKGIAALRDSLTARLKAEGVPVGAGAKEAESKSPYSHILVLVMGWNTPQYEAVRNVNSIVGHLVEEAESQDDPAAAGFRPLVVLVTWPSLWSISPWNPVPEPVIKGFSFGNKANDAEEVGGTWLREVVETAVNGARVQASRGPGAIKQSPKLVLIGHSFGARAMLAAVTGGAGRDILTLPDSVQRHAIYRPGDRFIALQGATRIETLFSGDTMEKPAESDSLGADGRQEELCDQNKGESDPVFVNDGLRLFATSSRFDSAVTLAFWGTYLGSGKAFETFCGESEDGDGQIAFSDKITCLRDSDLAAKTGGGFALNICGSVEGPDDPAARVDSSGTQRPITLIDSSRTINCNAAFTGGGAHSDIYRRETARLIWQLMNL